MIETIKYSLWISTFLVALSCIEEVAISNEVEQQSILVVEAVITDEAKFQEVRLTRSFELEGDSAVAENNATVRLSTNSGQVYNFTQEDNGYYRSTQQFAAHPNTEYSLEITTSDGLQFQSDSEQLPGLSVIDELVFERGFNENGVEGVSAFINASNENEFYRFEYEETYKIIAPQYSPQELIILNEDFPYPPEFLLMFVDNQGVIDFQEIIDFFFELQLRPEQEQICFNTVASNEILLASTIDLETNILNQHRVRFVNRNEYIIQHRYSLLVKQYSISDQAHEYYTILNDFSNNESIFSETQVGFLSGNLFSTNSDASVVGYFELSSVDEQRIYFNYTDLFPGEILPPYFVNCDDILVPALLEEDFAHNITNSPIIDALNAGFIFYQENGDENGNPFEFAPFQLVFQVCGDCTVLGQNQVPDFWED